MQTDFYLCHLQHQKAEGVSSTVWGIMHREYRMKNINFADNITKSQLSRELNLNLGGYT